MFNPTRLIAVEMTDQADQVVEGQVAISPPLNGNRSDRRSNSAISRKVYWLIWKEKKPNLSS